MAHKLLRWTLGVTGLILCLLMIAVAVAYYYMDANRDRLIQEAAHSAGMEVTYKGIDAQWWEKFPEITVVADSLTFRDTSVSAATPPLLFLDTFLVHLSLDAILQNTLRLQQVKVTGGQSP
jgi:hypothetical protein